LEILYFLGIPVVKQSGKAGENQDNQAITKGIGNLVFFGCQGIIEIRYGKGYLENQVRVLFFHEICFHG